MFCSNCGVDNPAGTGFCTRCGQALGSVAGAPAASQPPAVAKPAGTRRTLGLMPLWFILTVNIYWLFWLHKTYKEIRAHTPGATDVTPGKAVGFMFIPFFNIYWFFRIMTDMPRAIRRMQEDDPLGEPPLNNGLITGLLIAGILGNGIMGQFHPALMLLTEPLIIVGFILAQASLNAHWERHAAGVVPGARIAAPPAVAGALVPELGTLLGVRTPQIEWAAGAAFLIASLLADLVFLLLIPLLRHQGTPSPASWGLSFSADVILTAAAVAAFRWIRNDAGAAAIAATGYALLQAVVRVVILQLLLHGFLGPPVFLLYSLVANFLFLFILALAVRWLRPTWLGLWLGATAGQIAASLAYRVGDFLYSRAFDGFPHLFHIELWDVVQELLFAAVFAFAFWGGLALFAPKVLRD
jgi:hypothetical protein